MSSDHHAIDKPRNQPKPDFTSRVFMRASQTTEPWPGDEATPDQGPPWDGLKEQELLTLRIEVKEARLRIATIEALAIEVSLLASQFNVDALKVQKSGAGFEAARLKLIGECSPKT